MDIYLSAVVSRSAAVSSRAHGHNVVEGNAFHAGPQIDGGSAREVCNDGLLLFSNGVLAAGHREGAADAFAREDSSLVVAVVLVSRSPAVRVTVEAVAGAGRGAEVEGNGGGAGGRNIIQTGRGFVQLKDCPLSPGGGNGDSLCSSSNVAESV
jgi:hypothetical protein